MRSSVVLHGQRPVARSVSALLQGWRFAALLVGCHSFVAVVGHSRQVVAGAVEAAVAGNCMIGRVASVVRRIAGEGLVEGSYSYAGAAAAAVVYSSDELAMPCGELGFKKLDARILAARILLLLRRRTSVSSVTV
jgi:hypothetical protein